jgi:hypothetical protein
MTEFRAPPRRSGRAFGWLVPALIVLILAAGWSAFWFYAADRARTSMAGWMAREARAARVYRCEDERLGGFPFRIEITCRTASAALGRGQPPVTLATGEVIAAVQIYQPTLMLAEIGAPVTVADPAQPGPFVANWSLAQMSLRGTPRNPQRVSFAADGMTLDRQDADNKAGRVFAAKHAELHGRLAGGTVNDHPVIDVATRLQAATAPGFNPLIAQPFDLDADAHLVGLRDFQPKPWSERFREIQANDGRIELRQARLRQGEALAVASGTLKLSPAGRLDGELQVTAAGLEKVLPALGVDLGARAGNGRGERIGAALGLLDKLAPGALTGAMAFLGEPAELEGRRATRMLLRFKDGMAILGPVKLGQTPALF